MNQADQLLFKQLRECMKANDLEAAQKLEDALLQKGYNVPAIVNSESNIITGQKIEVVEDHAEYESDHHEPFEDDGAYADDLDQD